MSRSRSESPAPCTPKRRKLDQDPFVDSLQMDPFDICQSGSDGTGYISVVVFMTWPLNGDKLRSNVQAFSPTEGGRCYRFDVVFSGACASFLKNQLRLCVQDCLEISMKGVQIEKLKKSSGPNSLNMALKWDRGVVVKFHRRNGVDVEELVDVWKLLKDSADKENQHNQPETRKEETLAHPRAFSVQANAALPEIDWSASPKQKGKPSETDHRPAEERPKDANLLPPPIGIQSRSSSAHAQRNFNSNIASPKTHDSVPSTTISVQRFPPHSMHASGSKQTFVEDSEHSTKVPPVQPFSIRDKEARKRLARLHNPTLDETTSHVPSATTSPEVSNLTTTDATNPSIQPFSITDKQARKRLLQLHNPAPLRMDNLNSDPSAIRRFSEVESKASSASSTPIAEIANSAELVQAVSGPQVKSKRAIKHAKRRERRRQVKATEIHPAQIIDADPDAIDGGNEESSNDDVLGNTDPHFEGDDSTLFKPPAVQQVDVPTDANLDRPSSSRSDVAPARVQEPRQVSPKQQATELPHVSPSLVQCAPVQAPSEATVTKAAVKHTPEPAPTTSSIQIQQPVGVPAPAPSILQAGLVNERNETYAPIAQVGTTGRYNIIGVSTTWVTPAPQKTSTNDLKTSMKLVDPSNLDPGYLENSGILFNCFVRKWPGWLPAPKYGEVVILKDVHGKSFNYNTALVGFKEKLRWAIYDPANHTSYHGPPTTPPTPREDRIGNGGGGSLFSPFWEATPTELAYCKRLKEWWEAMLEEKQARDSEKIVVEIGGGTGAVDTSIKIPKREHRLICDAGSWVEPGGWFRCTVEVLRGFRDDHGVYKLYVTDYTSNTAVYPVKARWCDPLLSEYVLNIEMWDAAADHGVNMEPGEYYFLNNVKMKNSNHGYQEGRMNNFEKCRMLNEEDAKDNYHLSELLRRKRDWKEMTSAHANGFSYMLFRDVSHATMFMNCTVEVLYVDVENEHLYVTDYTRPPQTAKLPAGATKSWARHVEELVVQIALCDGQEDSVKCVESGRIYSIQKLRIIRNVVEDRFFGRLGGTTRLIQPADEDGEDAEIVGALRKRREEGLRVRRKDAEKKTLALLGVNEDVLETRRSTQPEGYSTIKEIEASENCPNKFRVIARVVDFLPFELKKCVFRRCTNCLQELKQCFKLCPDCPDEEVELFHRLFFNLQDGEENNLQVCVMNPDECSLLHGLKAVDLIDDLDALNELRERLKPFIGELENYHEVMEREGKAIVPATSPASFVIESWLLPNGSRGYGLTKCTKL